MFKALRRRGDKNEVCISAEEFDNFSGQLEAINRSQAVIEFNLDGTILTANQNFLDAMGYRLEEIQGKHHSMFADSVYKNSPEYKEFWAKLKRGEFHSGEYRRIKNGGAEIWIQASYNPIFNSEGRPYKVVKYAVDVTERKRRDSDMSGQIEAIHRSQAVIEFNLDGTIVNANDNFLQAMGYSLMEIVGNHHSMFVEPAERDSAEYRQFWDALRRGEFQSHEFKRIAKGGREIWIQASYNPIMDVDGRPEKVVKYASDITEQKKSAENVSNLVKEVSELLSRLVHGDLSQGITRHYDGALGGLVNDLNSLIRKLIEVTSNIRSSATVVSNTAREISQSNMDLSDRTEEQAASLERTSSSMEEMTRTVQSNAQFAQSASELALQARTHAERGGEVARTAVTAMSDISSASHKIEDIISVIDELAFQTNLLALNASVEAARAGEQGRGFSVVASEVRNLAGRSAAAAQEIKSLIQDSVTKVDAGSKLVNETGVVLDEIVEGVKEVSEIVGRISDAGQEQSIGIGQVNLAISQMDEATQQNASLVEETTNTSQTALHEAEKLMDQVSFFSDGSSESDFGDRRGANRPWSSQQRYA